MRTVAIAVSLFLAWSVLTCGGELGAPSVVVVTPGHTTLVSLGQTVQLAATVFAANGKPLRAAEVSWSSSDTSVVRVSETGLVIPLANGSVEVRAAVDGISGGATIVVAVPCPGPAQSDRVLVDASTDGGLWWYGTPHQGAALADFLRTRGFEVAELSRGDPVTCAALLAHHTVMRVTLPTLYGRSALVAYRDFLSCPTTLLYITAHQTNVPAPDTLAAFLGLVFQGAYRGSVSEFAPHPITDGVGPLDVNGGAAVASWDTTRVRILGWLDGGQPVMGVVESYAAKVFFIGDPHALIMDIAQPLVDNLIGWGF